MRNLQKSELEKFYKERQIILNFRSTNLNFYKLGDEYVLQRGVDNGIQEVVYPTYESAYKQIEEWMTEFIKKNYPRFRKELHFYTRELNFIAKGLHHKTSWNPDIESLMRYIKRCETAKTSAEIKIKKIECDSVKLEKYKENLNIYRDDFEVYPFEKC